MLCNISFLCWNISFPKGWATDGIWQWRSIVHEYGKRVPHGWFSFNHFLGEGSCGQQRWVHESSAACSNLCTHCEELLQKETSKNSECIRKFLFINSGILIASPTPFIMPYNRSVYFASFSMPVNTFSSTNIRLYRPCLCTCFWLLIHSRFSWGCIPDSHLLWPISITHNSATSQNPSVKLEGLSAPTHLRWVSQVQVER